MRCLTRISFIFLSLCLVFCIFTCSGFAQEKATTIDIMVRQLNARGQFNGSVLVIEHGEVLYENGFGEANVGKNLKFAADTPTYLASLTKQFTAMAVMILKDQGKLTYEDKLSKFFTGFPPYADSVTIRQLLDHTSGIPDYVGLGLERPGLTDADVLKALIKQPKLEFTPGSKFAYSNSGYILLAMIVEKVSEQPYSVFVKKNIFDRLGMKNTFVRERSTVLPPNIAVGYDRFGNPDDYTLLTYGEGGIYSSVKDFVLWDRALYTDKLVKQDTLKDAFNAADLSDRGVSNYGFGWGLGNYNGEPTASHAGRFGGFNTYIKRFLNSQNAVIFFTNHGFRNMSAIGNAIINILDGKSYDLPKLSVAEAMYRKYGVTGIDSALQLYASLKKNDDKSYDFSESELNELGYELLGMKKYDDAIAILKLNVEEFPNSSNVYDGLGEAFMKNGNKDLAIKNYKQSLELDPSNTHAVDMLKKLGVNRP